MTSAMLFYSEGEVFILDKWRPLTIYALRHCTMERMVQEMPFSDDIDGMHYFLNFYKIREIAFFIKSVWDV